MQRVCEALSARLLCVTHSGNAHIRSTQSQVHALALLPMAADPVGSHMLLPMHACPGQMPPEHCSASRDDHSHVRAAAGLKCVQCWPGLQAVSLAQCGGPLQVVSSTDTVLSIVCRLGLFSLTLSLGQMSSGGLFPDQGVPGVAIGQ